MTSFKRALANTKFLAGVAMHGAPGLKALTEIRSSYVFDNVDPAQANTNIGYGQPKDGIYVINRDGTGLRQLTRGDDYSPSWSPNGKRIVLERDVLNETSELISASLFVVDADGTSLQRLTGPGRANSPNFNRWWDLAPAWCR